MRKPSFIYIFTGDGKGKTSAALGTAVRALSHGWSVSWIAFYKEASWGISEHALPTLLKLPPSQTFEMLLLGKGFYLKDDSTKIKRQDGTSIKAAPTNTGMVVDDNTGEEHKLAALAALAKAQEILQREMPPQVLVLDEVCNAIADGLISESELLDTLALRTTTHIVLTGRSASKTLIDAADLVSEIRKVKHPYDSGELAVKGLDF